MQEQNRSIKPQWRTALLSNQKNSILRLHKKSNKTIASEEIRKINISLYVIPDFNVAIFICPDFSELIINLRKSDLEKNTQFKKRWLW